MKYLAFLSLAALLVGCGSDSSTPPAGTGSTLKDTYTPGVDDSLEQPKFEPPKDGDEVAVISTKFGKIVCKFRPDLAPKHVENFKTLAKKGFYDKTIFHRVIPGFMIQGGDPNTKDATKVESYGAGGPGYKVKNEFNNLDHRRGVLSMARSSDPDSAGSQFYICVGDSGQSLNRKYTAFGEVVSGLDIADKIVSQPRNEVEPQGPTDKPKDLPNERIEMTVKIEKWPVK